MHQGGMLKVVDILAGKKDGMTQRLEAAGKTRVGNQISCRLQAGPQAVRGKGGWVFRDSSEV